MGNLSVSIAPSTLINGKEKLRALHRVAATGELDEEIPYNQGGITESHRGAIRESIFKPSGELSTVDFGKSALFSIKWRFFSRLRL